MSDAAPNAMYDGLLRSAASAAIFSEERRLQSMLDVEAALAAVQARLGMIPEEAVEPIRSCCQARLFDRNVLAQGVAGSGNLAIPLVSELVKAVHAVSPSAAGYVHWGATSQDVIDSGLVLQLRDLIELTRRQLIALSELLASLAERYRATPMAGRTWLQQAVPVTFGLKAAGWLDAIERHQERLEQLMPRVLVLQFGGAAGTLASLGERGLDVAQGLAAALGLGLPALPWHSQRDRIVEVAMFSGLLMGTLGKIAGDLALLGQTEIAELAEPAEAGRGGSSTMPHKRNPVAAASILSSAIRVPGLVGTMLSTMRQEHERGLGGWQAEWETLPEICTLTSGALDRLCSVLKGLQVFPQAMLSNLDKTGGLLMAEAVSMALAEKIGKAQAHELVQAASRKAAEQAVHLRIAVEQEREIMRHLERASLEKLLEPAGYLGSTDRFVQAVLAKKQKRRTPVLPSPPSKGSLRMKEDTPLHYCLNNVPGKPVLLLSNSLGTDLGMWNAQADAFSKHFSLLRYDVRGHGRSFQPAGPYTIEQMGRDVLELLDGLGLERVHFCGLSMGGMVGQWIGVHAPERLDKLVLSNTAAKIGTIEGWNERIAAVRQGGLGAVVDPILERWFTPGFRASSPATVEATRQMLLSTPAAGYAASCGAVRDTDQRAVLQNITADTLVIYGTEDPVTTPADADLLLSRIPGARALALHAAHLANVERVGEFTTGVLHFLLAQ